MNGLERRDRRFVLNAVGFSWKIKEVDMSIEPGKVSIVGGNKNPKKMYELQAMIEHENQLERSLKLAQVHQGWVEHSGVILKLGLEDMRRELMLPLVAMSTITESSAISFMKFWVQHEDLFGELENL